jgi:WD repeat-containing protein 40A
LAIGAYSPKEIGIYRLPALEPLALLTGHEDIVFSLSWMDDTNLISGSRDQSVCLWSLSNLEETQQSLDTITNNNIVKNIHRPAIRKFRHMNKVRDLQSNLLQKNFLTCSPDSTIKLWDINKFEVSSTYSLLKNESVCIALDQKFKNYAIGSQKHISILDPRHAGGIVQEIASANGDYGVRSIEWQEHVLAVGGGLGRLSFYDIRNRNYLQIRADPDDGIFYTNEELCKNSKESELRQDLIYHQCSTGWIERGNTINHLNTHSIPNAIYSLKYDENGRRLFAAGGPLQLGVKGCFASIFA